MPVDHVDSQDGEPPKLQGLTSSTAPAPSVSVIVPVYNASAFVARCVANLRACKAAGVSMEIIFVDDCSTDGSYGLLEDAVNGLDYVTVASTAFNGGPGLARNVGLELARGQFIAFLDVDDAYIPSAFARLINFALEKHPDMVAFNGIVGDLGGKSGERRDMAMATAGRDARIRFFLRAEMDGSVIFSLFRRSFLAKNFIHFPPGLHEDIPVMFKCYYRADEILPFPEPVYQKYAEPTSIIHTISEQHVEGIIFAYCTAVLFLRQVVGNFEYYREDIQYGLRGFIADQVLKIRSIESKAEKRIALYNHLISVLNKIDGVFSWEFIAETKKDQVVKGFISKFPQLGSDRAAGLIELESGYPL